MRLVSNMRTIALTFILMSMLSMGTGCIKNKQDTPATAKTIQQLPPLNIGFTLTYDDTYRGESQGSTYTIIGEEIINDVDCYVWEFSSDEPWSRVFHEGQGLSTLLSYTFWRDKTNTWIPKAKSHVRTWEETEYSATTTNTLEAGDPNPPYYVGQIWTYDSVTVLPPGESIRSRYTFELEIADMEEVTVPAGTFNCYKINKTLIANFGVDIGPHELQRIIWWSAEENFPIAIKVSNFVSYDHPSTAELVSYAP